MAYTFDTFTSKLVNGLVDWDALTIRCLLTERALVGDAAYTPASSLTTVAGVLAVAPEVTATGYARQSATETITGITGGQELGTGTFTFPITDAGVFLGGALIYAFVTDDSASWPVSWHPEVYGTTTGADVVVTDITGAVRVLAV